VSADPEADRIIAVDKALSDWRQGDLSSTLEGQTLFRAAMRMLGISKVETLHKLGQGLPN
jgi:hypothetical protein